MDKTQSEMPGILAIWNNCQPGREPEFEEWFQHEHLQERLAVPGFLLGRRHEAVSGAPRYFNFYLTESPAVLTSAPYLARLNDPTPMTRLVMSEIFRDMIRTVCRRTLRLGAMRGTVAVTARFGKPADQGALTGTLESMVRDRVVACGEIWSAVGSRDLPVAEEERLRGGDRRIDTCLYVETLRQRDADAIAQTLSAQFPAAEVGVYRLLCEIRRAGT